MSNIKEVHGKPRLHVSVNLSFEVYMAAVLRDSVIVVVAVVRTRPQAIPLAMITKRKSTHGFPFLSYMSMGLRLAALRATGAPLIYIERLIPEFISRMQTIIRIIYKEVMDY